jgi:anti-sigma regulatory factor (Ser/Thr protein kinase)
MSRVKTSVGAEPHVVRLSPGPSSRLRWAEGLALDIARPEGVVIDLACVELAEPMLALRLAAVEEVQLSAGSTVSIIPPRAARVRDYLARAGLARLMGVQKPTESPDIFVPIACIKDQVEVERFAEGLQRALLGALPADLGTWADAMVLMFSELCDNACTHGLSEHGTFLLAQRNSDAQLVLVVGDLGVGIPGHLEKNLGEVLGGADEGRLIAEALKPGVTGVPSGAFSSRGNGLPCVIDTMRELAPRDAKLRIWSGLGRANVTPGLGAGSELRAHVVRSYTPGTWIELALASQRAVEG